MWFPLPRRCLGLQHGQRYLTIWPGRQRPAPAHHQHPGHERAQQWATKQEQRLFPARRRRGDRPLPAESAAPSATQEPRGRSGLAVSYQPCPRLCRPMRWRQARLVPDAGGVEPSVYQLTTAQHPQLWHARSTHTAHRVAVRVGEAGLLPAHPADRVPPVITVVLPAWSYWYSVVPVSALVAWASRPAAS